MNKQIWIFLIMGLSVCIQGIAQNNTFPASGNVGIGTTEPKEKLHVEGNLYMGIGEGFRLFGNPNYFAQYLDALIFQMEDANNTKGNTDGGFIFQGHTPTDGVTKEWMVIRTPGNVGIGTTSPSAKLDVRGGVSINGRNSTASVNGFGNSLQLISSSHAAIVYNPGDPTELMFGFHSNGNFYWGTGQNAGNEYAMQLSRSGNLGIKGRMTANEVKVKSGGWADHVFLEAYPLMPLDKLETFIRKHGHLPNIPTEAEVKEDGIDLGAMNAKLLEKVEELTLYLIRQQKIIEEQARHLEAHQNKLKELEEMVLNEL